MLVVGFLGAWEDWDNAKRSVRKLALDLRGRQLPGVYVETAGNHQRRVILRYIREALDQNRDRKLSAEEKQSVQFIFYGQSFGGAAAVKLARDLKKLGVPVRLTVQIDSVGKDDDRIPPNVSRALNLYQHDPGPVSGRVRNQGRQPFEDNHSGQHPLLLFLPQGQHGGLPLDCPAYGSVALEDGQRSGGVESRRYRNHGGNPWPGRLAKCSRALNLASFQRLCQTVRTTVLAHQLGARKG